MNSQLPLLIKEAEKIFLNNFCGKKGQIEIFYDLCFVLLVAQTPFLTTKTAVDKLKTLNFYNENLTDFQVLVAISSIRFKNRKLQFLLKMKKQYNSIHNKLYQLNSDQNLRLWLVKNIKGLGMKTASHFLRNIGYTNFAIIDSHILKYLKKDPPTNINEYLMLENMFLTEAEYYKTKPVYLDLAIWKLLSNVPWEKVTY
jgi:N-glycosylase/DNA lyase